MIVTNSRQELDPSLLKMRKREQNRGTIRSYVPLKGTGERTGLGERGGNRPCIVSLYSWGYLLPLCFFLFLLGTSLPYVSFPTGAGLRNISMPGEIALADLEELDVKTLRAETSITLPSQPDGEEKILWDIETQRYRLRENDRLSSLCQRYGLNMGTLISINRLESIRSLDEGDLIHIPETDGILYTVTEDDSFRSILACYKLREGDLMFYNPGIRLSEEGPVLFRDQEIFLPGVAMEEEELRRRTGQLYIFPIKGRILKPYGAYNDPMTKIEQFNNGIDIKGNIGDEVGASLSGTVVSAGFNNNYGNYVIVDHGNGYKSLYSHLSQIYVRRNDKVLQGGVIGTVGKTGYAAEAHLHFSLFKGKKSVDPMDFLH